MNLIRNSTAAKMKMLRQIVFFALILNFCFFGFDFQSVAQEEAGVSFDRDIRPILSDRCFACHGPDADSREADLRLDLAGGPDGAHVSVIEPGSAEDSELWNRITSDDQSEMMPPPESHKPNLTKSQQQLFRKWIEAGAAYETFWAFEQLTKSNLPSVKKFRLE